MRSRLLVALSLVIAVPLAAQSPSRGAEPVGGTWVVRGMPSIQRAVVGIVVNTAMPSNDETGYPITLITPGSPADRAGLRTGDYVTRVNGQPLTSAAVQLWLLQSRLTPDDTVAIEYRRGNLRRTVHLVPMVVNEPPLNGALGSLHRAEAVTVPDEWEGSVFAYRLANPRSALMNIELAPLNPTRLAAPGGAGCPSCGADAKWLSARVPPLPNGSSPPPRRPSGCAATRSHILARLGDTPP